MQSPDVSEFGCIAKPSTVNKIQKLLLLNLRTKTMKRYFECIKGSSCKFYEVEVAGTVVNTRYGRIGSTGQSQTKAFTDAATAEKHASKLVEQKLGKGYVDQTAA
jgi:predicted DNA-binding WGR domain protein